MYISIIIFVVLYLLDVTAGYYIADIYGALGVGISIPIGMFIQMKLMLFQADVIRLDDLAPYDKNKLALAFENVLQSGERLGYNFKKNPKIYLSEETTLNAFNCGNAIVINRGLMNSGCLEGVIAHEVKHWRFLDSYTSCLVCNTVTILSLLAIFMLNVYIFAIAFIIGMIIAVFGSGTAGVLVGSFIGRFLGKLKDLMLRVIFFIMNALQALLSRYTEFKADEFAVKLGYAEQLKQFLHITYESRRMESLYSRLLSSHPSDSQRLGYIGHIQNQLNENEETLVLPFQI